MTKRYIYLFIISLCTLSLHAQSTTDNAEPTPSQSLSLDTYRQKVLDYSWELKQSKEEITGADYSKKLAVANYFPTIDLTADLSYDALRATHVNDKLEPFDYTIGANFMQNVYAGGAIIAQHKMAKTKCEMSQIALTLSHEELIHQAEIIYWQAAANKEMLSNAKAYYDVVKNLFDIINQRFDDGYVSKSDLLMVNTRLKEAELQWNNAQRATAVAFQNLNILMGEPITAVIDVSDEIDIVYPMPPYQTLEEILSLRPEYQLAEKNVQMQEEYIATIHAQYNPKIAVGLKAGWGSPYGSAREPNWSTLAYASVSFPLLDWGKRYYAVRTAKVEVNKLNMEKSRITDNINTELSTAWINLNNHYKRIAIARDNFTTATENLELNTLKYNEGQLPILDVLSAQLSWIQAYNATVEAEYNYKVAYSDYKKATGKRE